MDILLYSIGYILAGILVMWIFYKFQEYLFSYHQGTYGPVDGAGVLIWPAILVFMLFVLVCYLVFTLLFWLGCLCGLINGRR